MPTLFVIRGVDQGSRFELEGPILRLGRDSSNAVQLHDTEVSRQHAEIRCLDDQFSISDLDSSNGTFVNGRRIQHQPLQTGDQIQIGGTSILFTGRLEEADDLAHAVDIGLAQEDGDSSRIVHTVSQEEGSKIFDARAEAPQNSWLARARSNLQIMYRTALAVSHTLDIDQLLQRIMELIFEWVECDRGCILLMDSENKVLQPRVHRSRDRRRVEDKITISKTILDYVIGKNEGVITSDARLDDRWDAAGSILQMGIREAICVPMQGRYDVVGAIYIDTSTTPQHYLKQGGSAKFTEDHLKLMIAIGHQAALAVEDTRYYSAMVQAERLAAVGQTIATLSHHIKNILQGIRGGSYLIEMGLNEHDEEIVRKGWNIVDKNQNKISAMVLDMLTFSKEREPDLVPADLNGTVGDVIELMQVRAKELEVRLDWQPDATLPELVFDPEGIHRAVLNVVTNAIDAVAEDEPPGRVTVRTAYDAAGPTARIVVEDDGPGIPADQKELLFTAFVSSRKSRGTGLGLPVSQKIVQEHGGKILVESQPGHGARFTIELPANLTASEEPAPDATSKTAQHG
ncbi:MAG: FHA domain-containing protein [Pirellulales bacterium]|nr:FHA domain-containing protein [Pirellulales bacterium]